MTVPVNARSRVQWVLGEQALLPLMAARARVDLVHSLASTAPLWGPFRRVSTVHDLIYARFPEAHAGIRDKGMKLLVPWGVRRCDRVIAISQSTRADLIELLGTKPDRIDVVPLGFGAVRRAMPLPESETRARFDLDEREVVLSLSAKRPHKNLLGLISALALIPPSAVRCSCSPATRRGTSGSCASVRRALGVAADVRFPGWVADCGARGPVDSCVCVRVPVAVRGLRAAGARGDGAGGAGGVLERLLAAGGGGRCRAAVRPAR